MLLAPPCPRFEQARLSRLFETSATTHRTAQCHVLEVAVLSSTRGEDYPLLFAGLLAAGSILRPIFLLFLCHHAHVQMVPNIPSSLCLLLIQLSLFQFTAADPTFLQTTPKYFPSLCLSLLNSQSNLCRHYLNPYFSLS